MKSRSKLHSRSPEWAPYTESFESEWALHSESFYNKEPGCVFLFFGGAPLYTHICVYVRTHVVGVTLSVVYYKHEFEARPGERFGVAKV